jgi:hypothetical protein
MRIAIMIARFRLAPLLAGAAVLTSSGCKKDSESAATKDVAMAPAEEVKISSVELGRQVGPDKRVTAQQDDFTPRDTIYASVLTTGSAPTATVVARWTFEDGQVVKEDSRTIAPNGAEATEFHISKPSGWPKGDYKLTVSVGGSTQSKDFEVK